MTSTSAVAGTWITSQSSGATSAPPTAAASGSSQPSVNTSSIVATA
jgi:hypothetical protein